MIALWPCSCVGRLWVALEFVPWSHMQGIASHLEGRNSLPICFSKLLVLFLKHLFKAVCMDRRGILDFNVVAWRHHVLRYTNSFLIVYQLVFRQQVKQIPSLVKPQNCGMNVHTKGNDASVMPFPSIRKQTDNCLSSVCVAETTASRWSFGYDEPSFAGVCGRVHISFPISAKVDHWSYSCQTDLFLLKTSHSV